MVYSYILVSTDKQDYSNQEFFVLQYANRNNLGNVEFTSETISGKVSWKDREISKLIEGLQKGDILIVSELSRLGRTMLEIFELISILLRKDVEIHVVKGNIILKDDIQSKVFTFAFSLGSEIERDLISQRTKEALASKKASGVKLGRPKGSQSSKLDKYVDEIKKYRALGVSVTSIAKILQVPQPTLHYFCKSRKLI